MFRPASPLDNLFHRYGLDLPSGFRPVDAGLLNRSYQVVAGDSRYFLKHYLPWRDGCGHGLPDAHGRPRSGDSTLRWQHRASAELAATGFPAATPLQDRSGQTLVRVRGRPFALFPWLEGVHRDGADLGLPGARRLGEALARIHLGLATVLPPVPQPLFVPTKSERQSLAEADRLLGLVRARPRPDDMDELAEFRLCERRRLVPEVAHRRPGADVLGTVGYVHGDFHPGNVFWSSTAADSQITAVLDWEKTTVGPYGDEVVSAAMVFFTDQHSGLPDLEAVRSFVGGYASARPQLSPADITTAVHRVWWERLTDFWILVWRYELGDPRADPLFPGTAALVPWWTDNYEKVLEAFLTSDAADSTKPRTPSAGRTPEASPLISSLTSTVMSRAYR